MDLYFSPLTCSLASRIAIYEAGLQARFHNVEIWEKRVEDGRDYFEVTAGGRVPALLTEDGLLTENAAILQRLADMAPESGLAPAPDSPARYRLQQWLSFVGAELHKGVFALVLPANATEERRRYALEELLPPRFDQLEAHLAETEGGWLTGAAFSVADAYLFVVLVWADHVGVDMARWPRLEVLRIRAGERPAVARAFGEEWAMGLAARRV